MGVTPETKVGVFTTAALLALFSLFFWLNRVNFLQKGAEVEVIFERIDSLRPGAPAKYIGVDIGRISKIYFEKDYIVVAVHINQGFELPHTSKATIASAGVVGDKFLELEPLKPGETPLPGKRIKGYPPASLDQFYDKAYQVLESLQTAIDSINKLVNDPETTNSIKNSLVNIEKITASAKRMIATNEVIINELVRNANTASIQLAEASATANRFLGQFTADGRTVSDLKEALAYIKKVSIDLEKFSAILAEQGPQVGVIMDDAHKTMQSINQAAQSVNKAVNSLTGSGEGEGGGPGIRETLNQAGSAVQKVSTYVNNFEKISLTNHLGMGYRSTDNLTVDYRMDLNFNGQNGLALGVEDIGHANEATLQYKMIKPSFDGRVGIYKNQFGLGVDAKPSSNCTFGVDLWDTHAAKFGLSSNWRFTPVWNITLSAYSELTENDPVWSVGCWRKF
jgi:phospholipid/cholesterol/gamma-HCH transport system substrate-binding protein